MRWDTHVESIDLDNVFFSNEVLLRLDIRSIVFESSKVGSVDLSKVIGTTHPRYGGRTWGQLKPVPGTLEGNTITNRNVALQPLSRAVPNVIHLVSNPVYYLGYEEKVDWSFYKIEENYYISSGNNRTVIGRYFLHLNNRKPIIHGVKIMPARFRKKVGFTSNLGALTCKFLGWLKK